jgi:heme A synthase
LDKTIFVVIFPIQRTTIINGKDKISGWLSGIINNEVGALCWWIYTGCWFAHLSVPLARTEVIPPVRRHLRKEFKLYLNFIQIMIFGIFKLKISSAVQISTAAVKNWIDQIVFVNSSKLLYSLSYFVPKYRLAHPVNGIELTSP